MSEEITDRRYLSIENHRLKQRIQELQAENVQIALDRDEARVMVRHLVGSTHSHWQKLAIDAVIKWAEESSANLKGV